jgi:hypothetical protein
VLFWSRLCRDHEDSRSWGKRRRVVGRISSVTAGKAKKNRLVVRTDEADLDQGSSPDELNIETGVTVDRDISQAIILPNIWVEGVVKNGGWLPGRALVAVFVYPQ